jgi:hypothetical protein
VLKQLLLLPLVQLIYDGLVVPWNVLLIGSKASYRFLCQPGSVKNALPGSFHDPQREIFATN